MATCSSILSWRIPWTEESDRGVWWATVHGVPKSQTQMSIHVYTSSDRILQTLSSVQLLTLVQFFEPTWTAAHQVSLLITNSQSLFKLMSIKSVMPTNHLINCHPLPFSSSCLQSFPVSGSFPKVSYLTVKCSGCNSKEK